MAESIEEEDEDLLPAHPVMTAMEAKTAANETGPTKLLNLETIRFSLIFP
ncbi:MAG: hypothetical protein JWP91_752 [Fibrobacteres bacterium]|nr:hypothetical protein [Fibrobacterota bacterium]